MLNKIRKDLRISNHEFDEEIEDLISAAKQDLILAGILIAKEKPLDPLIKRAISIYCKANFGFDNPDFEKLNTSYQKLKDHMANSDDYTE